MGKFRKIFPAERSERPSRTSYNLWRLGRSAWLGVLPTMEQFRNYLWRVALAEMEPWLRGKLDPADVVQQTLLKAYQSRDRIHGRSLAQHLAWLRSIVHHHLIDARRKFGREGETSFPVGGSTGTPCCPGDWLADDASSPSQLAIRSERIDRLHKAIDDLPDDRRTALELRYFQGLSVPEVSRRMGRSTAAVAGLLRRGLSTLREVLDENR